MPQRNQKAKLLPTLTGLADGFGRKGCPTR